MKDKINSIIAGCQKAVVVSHLNPDGDAVGAALATTSILKILGIEAYTILPNAPAPNLRVIEGVESILYHLDAPHKSAELIASCDLIFCVDFNNIHERIGSLKEPILANKKAKKVLIDHHQFPMKEDFDLVISDTSKSSTSLMVYEFAQTMGVANKIDIPTAEALYVGMITDTGNFTYGNLTPQLFYVVGKLVEAGVAPNLLYTKVFNSQSESQIRLRSFALSNKMFINRELKCGYIVLTKSELKQFNFVEGDLEGLVNVPLSIEGIVNSAIFIEKNTLIKISLRSLIEGIDVNIFSREYFNGGGHINAAGGKSITPIDEAVQIYLSGLKKTYNKQ